MNENFKSVWNTEVKLSQNAKQLSTNFGTLSVKEKDLEIRNVGLEFEYFFSNNIKAYLAKLHQISQ